MSMSVMIPKSAWGILAGIFGTAFLGYCIYFDHKRHKDPDFKKKLREKRLASQPPAIPTPSATKFAHNFPNINDCEDVQRFFLHEVQIAEEFLTAGDIENGVDHISNALAICAQPQQLLQLFQQTLQPHIFQILVQRLKTLSPRVINAN